MAWFSRSVPTPTELTSEMLENPAQLPALKKFLKANFKKSEIIYHVCADIINRPLFDPDYEATPRVPDEEYIEEFAEGIKQGLKAEIWNARVNKGGRDLISEINREISSSSGGGRRRKNKSCKKRKYRKNRKSCKNKKSYRRM